MRRTCRQTPGQRALTEPVVTVPELGRARLSADPDCHTLQAAGPTLAAGLRSVAGLLVFGTDEPVTARWVQWRRLYVRQAKPREQTLRFEV
jgi:hypothetical protein